MRSNYVFYVADLRYFRLSMPALSVSTSCLVQPSHCPKLHKRRSRVRTGMPTFCTLFSHCQSEFKFDTSTPSTLTQIAHLHPSLRFPTTCLMA